MVSPSFKTYFNVSNQFVLACLVPQIKFSILTTAILHLLQLQFLLGDPWRHQNQGLFEERRVQNIFICLTIYVYLILLTENLHLFNLLMGNMFHRSLLTFFIPPCAQSLDLYIIIHPSDNLFWLKPQIDKMFLSLPSYSLHILSTSLFL